MKILFVYDCLFPDSVGGVEHRHYQLARQLAALGHQVTLAGWGDPALPRPEPLRYITLPFATKLHDSGGKRGIGPTLRFALACLKLDVSGYDIIETANIPYLHLFCLSFACARAKKPLVVTWHEYFGPLWKEYKGRLSAPLFAIIENLSARLGTAICAVSGLTAGRLQKKRKGTEVPIIPNGVDLDLMRKTAAEAAPDLPLLYAGRLIPEKQVDLLLNAVALLAPEAPILRIIGDGPDRPRLESLAEKLGIRDKILFDGRYPTAEDMWKRLAGAKIAVQPSSREGFGMFPLEAMALGKPVIYCKAENNALSELVRDGIEGLAADPTPSSLASAIASLLHDEKQLQKRGSQAAERASLFDWRKLAIATEAFFTAYLKTNRRPIR